MSQGNSVTVDISSGSKCHGGQNLGGCNVKALCSLASEMVVPITSAIGWLQ
jgi:hypothetical protein